MAGDADNTVDAFDLVGDVRFSTSRGCAAFNSGLAVAEEPEPETPVGGGGSGSEDGSGAGNGGSGDGSGDGSGPTAEQPRAAGGGLPRTGANLLSALALGLVLVAGGSWLLARRESTV